jgi:hypothetical protein
MSSFDEPVGFAEWVGRHCRIGEHGVPRAGSKRRRMLAGVFAVLTVEGVPVAVMARGLEDRLPETALAWVWGDQAARDDPTMRARP